MNDNATMTKPRSVGRAVTLLYASLVLGVVRGGLEARSIASNTSPGSVLLVALLVLLVIVGCVYLIGIGRAWARMAFLILFVLGLPFSIRPMVESFAASPLSGVLGIAQMVTQAYALVLLFQRPASNWFRAVKHANRPA